MLLDNTKATYDARPVKPLLLYFKGHAEERIIININQLL